ncbi:hypothetical protein JAAARDRAFT_691396 [Jaapia argillacea MUCL 33604]|uniref:F-box domain-containing protein n=1 Tax=Jaapia argillacea MUCL 33604 TaxID=933084 RepID=A0A067PYZ4_9AGAM|nr:hypothetical protein JAAARDRAFT_691396 [Jaapia argillacea MUCL 33604]
MGDIKNLPNELLELVFRYAVTSARPVGENQEVPFPVSASHVCRYWRELSLNTSDLWSRLNISIRRPWEEERVRVYLERSRTALLDIRLSRHDWADKSSQHYDESSSMKMPAFVSLLIPHIHRWRTLAINIDADMEEEGPCFIICNQLNDHTAPRLEYLHISVIDPLLLDKFIPQPIEPILVHGASALTKVRLRNVIAGDDSLPFQHVTTLDLGFSNDYASPTEYSDIEWVLKSSPHLEHLTLRGRLFHVENNTSVIELPFLQSLKVVFGCDMWTYEYFRRIFNILLTPALKTLEFYALSDYVFHAFLRAIEDSIPQSKFPALETFGVASLRGLYVNSDHFFTAMPQVTHV